MATKETDTVSREELKAAIEAAAKAAREEALTMFATLQAAQQAATPKAPTPFNPRQAPPPKPTCNVCLLESTACKGKHVRMAVWPKNDDNVPGFDGIFVNGITFKSSGPAHLIDVPADSDIPSLLAQYEASQEKLRRNNGFRGNRGGIYKQVM